MSSGTSVRYEPDGPVSVITIDRPDRMNAIDGEVHGQLVDVWRRFDEDQSASVAVLAGSASGPSARAAISRPPSRATRRRRSRPRRSSGTTAERPTESSARRAGPTSTSSGCAGTHLAIADEHATFGVTCRRWNIGLADGGAPAAAAHRRLPTGDGADHHGPGDRRRGGVGRSDSSTRSFPPGAVWSGLRIEAECFGRSILSPQTLEGLRRFNERDHRIAEPATSRSRRGSHGRAIPRGRPGIDSRPHRFDRRAILRPELV